MKQMTKNVLKLLLYLTLLVFSFMAGIMVGFTGEQRNTINRIERVCKDEAIIFIMPYLGEEHRFACIYVGVEGKRKPKPPLPNTIGEDDE